MMQQEVHAVRKLHLASLNDPKHMLDGTGKDMRHVKIPAVDRLDQSAVLDLIQQAAKLV